MEEENYPKIVNGKEDLIKINQEKDKQILYNDIESDDDVGDPEKNIQDKDVDSVREREIENEIINSGGEVTEETLTVKINHFRGKRMLRNNKYSQEIIYSESSQGQEGISSKKKYKFKFEDDYSGDEGANPNYHMGKKGKKSRNQNHYSTERNSLQNESFSPSEINNIQNDIIQKTEYISFTEAIKNPSVSYWDYYLRLIQLKQPIIGLFSPIKCLKIEESYIPTLVKLMRIIFIFSLNMFFNVLHLEQKYFRAKYKYFNKKYNIRYVYLDKNISLSERFAYGLEHAILSGFISFLICLIIQSIFNYFFFNIKKKLAEIESVTKVDSNQKNNNKNTNKKDILELMKQAKKCYIIFFSIGFGIMIIIFYSVIIFSEVYIGGVLDFIAGVFWAFIFLQIIPFIYCLIFSFCRYKGIKNNNEKLYKIGQSIFF